MLEENVYIVSKLKKEKVDVISTNDAPYFGAASKVLSDLLKLCAKGTTKLGPFATKPSRGWVHRGGVVKNLGVVAALKISVIPYSDERSISVAR